jgi:hypothetical protein
MIGHILTYLQKEEISFEDLFEIKIFCYKKNRPRKMVRHKGYRDHGSLGPDSIGLTPDQLKKLLTGDDLLYYESEGFTQQDLYRFYESPALYENIWKTYL